MFLFSVQEAGNDELMMILNSGVTFKQMGAVSDLLV